MPRPLQLLLFVTLWSAWLAPVIAPAYARHPALPGLSEQERAWLGQNRDKLILFYNTEFPPIEFSSPTGEFIGLGADIIAEVEKRLGVTFLKYPCSDWNRHLAALESGECAIAPTIVRTVERERYAYFTSVYATVPVVIITARTTSSGLTLDDLGGRRVAVVSGYATEKYVLERARGRFEVVEVKSPVEGLRELSFGQVNAFVENLAVAAYYIGQEGLPNLRVAGSTDYSFGWSIGVSRRYPHLYSAIQKALDDIPPEELDAMRKRWISLEVPRGMSREALRLIKVAALLTLVMLLSLTVITFFLKRRLDEKVASLKLAQKELLDQSERLGLATEATNAGIWDIYPATGRAYFSDQWYTMLGYDPKASEAELIDWIRLIHPDDAQAVKRAFKDYVEGGGKGVFEAEFRLGEAGGSWRWVLGKGRAIAWDDGGAPIRIIGLNLDIQRLKAAEAALRESEELYRGLISAIPDLVLRTALDGTIFYVNDVDFPLLRQLGREAVIGRNVFEFVAPEDLDRAREITRRMFEAYQGIREYRLMGARGEVITCEVNGDVLRTDDGTPFGMVYVVRDVTARRCIEDEHQKLQGQLLQAQKMESVGRLAGGVAHDFNNMLGAIMGNAELALSKMDASAPMRRNIEQVLEAAQRSVTLTRQLLAFARKQTIDPKTLDLNETVAGMLNMLRRLIGEDIELVWKPQARLWPVMMDPSQVDQILVNLCINAKDAIAGHGAITIETANVVLEPAACSAHEGLSPGQYVMVAVSDSGCGMDSQIRAKIFDPFFTTKEVGKGTGLGLAMVYGIVKQNDGAINLYSEPGRGSVFKIYIPRHPGLVDAPAENGDQGIPRGEGEAILLVEDEPAILEMGAIMLRSLGYEVASAGTPREAIRLAAAHAGSIQLLMTDVIMPEMNGKELAQRLLALAPQIKVLFMSGYTANVIAHQGVLDEGVHFIQKPFSLVDLARKVRAALKSAV